MGDRGLKAVVHEAAADTQTITVQVMKRVNGHGSNNDCISSSTGSSTPNATPSSPPSMACSNGNKDETNAVPNTTESSRSSSNRNNTSSAASTKKLQGDNHTSS